MKITQQTEASLEYTHKDTPTSMGRNMIQTFVNMVKQVYKKIVPKIASPATLHGHLLAKRSLTRSQPNGKADVTF